MDYFLKRMEVDGSELEISVLIRLYISYWVLWHICSPIYWIFVIEIVFEVVQGLSSHPVFEEFYMISYAVEYKRVFYTHAIKPTNFISERARFMFIFGCILQCLQEQRLWLPLEIPERQVKGLGESPSLDFHLHFREPATQMYRSHVSVWSIRFMYI